MLMTPGKVFAFDERFTQSRTGVASRVMVLLPFVALLLAAPPPAPKASDPTAEKKPLATVVTGTKDVKVRRDGKGAHQDARAGQELGANDEVVVPADGFAILHLLDNGYAVRLDDALTLRVGDLAMLKAKPKEESLESQLNRLLTPSERASKDRLLGWHVGLAAANVRSSEGKQKAAELQPQKQNAAAGGGTKTGAGPAPPKPPAPLGGLDAKGPHPASPPPPGAATPAPPPPVEQKPAQRQRDESTEGDADDVAQRTPPPETRLRTCLIDHAKALGLDDAPFRGEFTLRARRVGDELQLSLANQMPVPACAIEAFAANPRWAGLPEQWKAIKVPTK